MSTTKTGISWTDRTWNVVRGCARISAGCERCYAERTAYRFNGKSQPYEGLTVLGKHGPRWTGEARFVAKALDEPLRWRRPARIFVNSMSDLWHHDVTDEQIAAVFGVMAACPQHTFQILTKRPDRMVEWFRWVERELEGNDPWASCANHFWKLSGGREASPGTPMTWPLPNVHLGVSCEDQQRADERISLLVQCPAAVHFVSAEPLLGPIDFGAEYLTAKLGRYPFPMLETEHRTRMIDLIDWVICGGESGPGARPCDVEWIRSIIKHCKDAGVACFVKQLGAKICSIEVDEECGIEHWPTWNLRDRKGADMNEWPSDLRIQEHPR